MYESITLARWESRSGRDYLEARSGEFGPAYVARGASGFRPDLTDAGLVAWCEQHANDFQSDANKTPMRRVR
jgi:hypothetical protein